MFISPYHHTSLLPDQPTEEWPIELLIEIFHAQVDGWHLEVADRIINGWLNQDGQEAINTFHHDGRPTVQIPDAGWATLQIVLSYFETIAFFKNHNKDKTYERFCWGVYDVFPEYKNHKLINVAQHLYKNLRTGLYHGISSSQKTFLQRTTEAIVVQENGYLTINPHTFVRVLRKHLNEYCKQLSDESNVELRRKFKDAFLAKYTS